MWDDWEEWKADRSVEVRLPRMHYEHVWNGQKTNVINNNNNKRLNRNEERKSNKFQFVFVFFLFTGNSIKEEQATFNL